MNKARRTELNAIRSSIEEIKSRLETVLNDEQEYFDNMPESLQSGERGQAAETAIGSMESAAGSLEEALSSIEEAEA